VITAPADVRSVRLVRSPAARPNRQHSLPTTWNTKIFASWILLVSCSRAVTQQVQMAYWGEHDLVPTGLQLRLRSSSTAIKAWNFT